MLVCENSSSQQDSHGNISKPARELRGIHSGEAKLRPFHRKGLQGRWLVRAVFPIGGRYDLDDLGVAPILGNVHIVAYMNPTTHAYIHLMIGGPQFSIIC